MRINKIQNNTSIIRNLRSAAKLLSTSALTAAGLVSLFPASALAVDNFADWDNVNIVAGNATVTDTGLGTTNIEQHSVRAVGEAQELHIGSMGHVNIDQMSGNSLFVARVIGNHSDPTQILGKLTADGQVMILDRNGVIFGVGSQVDVAGIAVSTGDVSNADVMDGDGVFHFDNFGAGKILLQGTINLADAGLAAFVSPTVVNSGVINAKLGKVAFAAGDKVTLDLYGDKLVELEVTGELADALLENTGTINAEGGTVQMTASAAKEAVDNIINVEGVVTVASATQQGGKIILSGGNNGTVKVSGKLDASGKTGGGNVDVKGRNIQVADTAEINVSATESGNAGTALVIAQDHADFRGTIFGRGGLLGGNGGFAEVSGYGSLGFSGYTDMGAENGEIGSLLLDPTFAVIHSGLVNNPLGFNYIIASWALANSLANNNVTVQADQFIDVGTPAGGYNTGNFLLDLALNTLTGSGAIDLSAGNVVTQVLHHYEPTNKQPGQPGYQGAYTACNTGNSVNCVPVYTTTTTLGITNGNLTLDSGAINFNKSLIMGNGNVVADAETINLNSRIYGRSVLGGSTTLLGDSRLIGTAAVNNVNVLSNSASINQALNFADDATALTTVNVASGTYTENLTINESNVKLKGAAGATVQAAAAGNLVTVTGDNVNIDPIVFDGLGVSSFGIYADGADNLVVDGNTFKNFTNHGIYAVNSTNVDILGNTLFGNANNVRIDGGADHDVTDNTIDGGQRGVTLAWTGANSTVSGNTIGLTTGTSDNAIYVYGNTGATTVSGNHVYNAGWDGINVSSGTGFVTVQNNDIHNTLGASGIAYVFHNGDGLIDGNTVDGADRLGIYIGNTDNLTISNNTVSDTGREGNALFLAGIYLEGADSTTVDGNTINNTGGNAIQIGGAGNWAAVTTTGNVITDNLIGTLGGANNIKGDGIRSDASNGVIIKGNTITETHFTLADVNGSNGSGIQVVNTNGATIGGAGGERNTITNSGWDGIRLQNNSAITVDNNLIDNTERVGIWGGNISTAIISNNIVNHDNLGGYGSIHADGGSNWTVTGNDVEFGDYGIRLNGTGGTNSVANNHVDTVTAAGIYADGVSGLTVDGNFVGYGVNGVLGGDDTTIGTDGIYVNASNGAVVKRNKIVNAGDDGIEIVGSSNVTVGGATLAEGNIVNRSGHDGITTEGGDNVDVLFNAVTDTLGASGVAVHTTTNSTVQGNVITNANLLGIYGQTSHGIQILDNVVTNVGYGVSAGHPYGNGIGVESANVVTITGNTVDTARSNGISVGLPINNGSGASTSVTVDSNKVRNVGVDGIVVDGGALSVSGNTVNTAGDDGIDVRNSAYVDVKNNKIGYLFDGATPGADNNIGGDGIVVINSGYADIIGNAVTQAVGNGIFLDPSDWSVIAGNTITSVDLNGIYSEGNSNVTIGGATNNDRNYIRYTGQNGIKVEGGSDNTVRNNVIANTGVGGNASGLTGNGIYVVNSGSADILDNRVGYRRTSGHNITSVSGSINGDGILVVNADGTSGNKTNIKGNYVTETVSPKFDSGSGIQVVDSDYVDVGGSFGARNTISNIGWDGVRVAGGSNVVVDNNDIDNVTRSGIYFGGVSNGTVKRNDIDRANQYYGIHVSGGSNILVDDNDVDTTNLDGIFAEYVTSPLVISNNDVGTNGAGNNIKGNGIYVSHSDYASIHHNDVTQTVLNGIKVNPSSYVDIYENDIWNVDQDGINVAGGTNVEIWNNDINNTGDDGIDVDGNSDASIRYNDIYNTTGNGIEVSSSWNVDIHHNDIDEVDGDGINVTTSDYADIYNNRINLSVGSANTLGDGIDVSNTYSAWIYNNDIDDTADAGVELTNTDSVRVFDNRISDADVGVRLNDSGINGAEVDNNDIWNVDTGVWAKDVSGLVITDNDIDGRTGSGKGDVGIYVEDSYDALIGGFNDGNDVEDFDIGIRVIDSASADIEHNDVSEFTEYGIRVSDSDYVDVKWNDVYNYGGSGTGIRVYSSDNAEINDNDVSDLDGHGIELVDSDYVDILNNDVTDVGQHGIFVDPSDFVDIAYNYISNAGWDGVHVDDGNYAEIWDNDIYHSGDDGIDVNDNDGVEIWDNYIYSTGDHYSNGNGIEVSDSFDADIRSNEIWYAGGDGIEVTDSAYADIRNNDVYWSWDDGIDVDSSYSVDIVGNHVHGTDVGNGIEVTDSYDAEISWNDVHYTDQDGIFADNIGFGDVRWNDVHDTGDDGIDVRGSYRVDIVGNDVWDTDADGIQVRDSWGADVTWNTVDDAGDDGIDVENSAFADVNNNRVHDVRNNGIEVENSFDADVNDNHVGYTGDDGIYVSNSFGADIRRNYVHDTRDDGIDVRGSDYVDVADNTTDDTRGDGIQVLDSNFIDVLANTVTDAGDDGIDVQNTYSGNINGNTVDNVDANGIELTDSSYVTIDGNTVTNADLAGIFVDPSSFITVSGNTVHHNGTGIQFIDVTDSTISGNQVYSNLFAGIDLQNVDRLNILTNNIYNNGSYGLLAGGKGGNGSIVLKGNTFTDNPVGARFESGAIDISDLGSPNTFRVTGGYNPVGGVVGMQFDGDPSVLNIVGNTLGATVFEGFGIRPVGSAYYVRIEDGSIMDAPGVPTVIDGLNASFDGLIPALTGGILSPANLAAIEDRLWDADDLALNGRGQIFVGVTPSAAFSLENIEDFFRRFAGFGATLRGLNVTITGLPLVDLNAARALANLAPNAGDETAPQNIEPAAGGDETAATAPQDVEPAAGEDAACWGDAINTAGTGAVASFSFGGTFEEEISQAANCGAQASL